MFTFKTERPKGDYSSFYNTTHNILIKKKKVGRIEDKYPHRIRLMVIKENIMEDNNPNSTWKWITLTHESESVKDAKEWLKIKYNRIVETYNLYKQEL